MVARRPSTCRGQRARIRAEPRMGVHLHSGWIPGEVLASPFVVRRRTRLVAERDRDRDHRKRPVCDLGRSDPESPLARHERVFVGGTAWIGPRMAASSLSDQMLVPRSTTCSVTNCSRNTLVLLGTNAV